MHMVDWMPTFARLLGQDVPGDPCWDGRDQWETLAEGAPAEAGRTFFWNLLHDRFAVQEDGWKLIRRRDGEEWREELFHLAEDPDEEHECAATHPDRVEHLRRRVEEQHALDDASRRADAPGDPAIKV
jgi:arylsulfatase A-like enzyme